MLNCSRNGSPTPTQATDDLEPRTSLGRALGSFASAVVLASSLFSMASCGGGAGTAGDAVQARALDATGTDSPTARIEQRASVDWVKVANEGETFGVSEATTVRYGSGSAWVQFTATGQVRCTNEFFGTDPAYGVFKQCELATGSEQAVTVDVTRVIKDTPVHPLGLNTNYLTDDDANRPAARTLVSAMGSMKVKYLRYPGGEKSDAYLWSVPPFDRARPTLARTGPYEWPSGDRNLVQPDGVTFKVDPLDFDEFMAVALQLGAEPVLVVSYDGMFKAATPGGTAPTRQQLLDTAREWVRYANITRKFGVKYWELGNESYLPNSYNGSTSAEVYAQDLIDFSRAMKAVDPSIQIGAAGGSSGWWQTVLSTASGSIDFLSVHDYPANAWGSYDHYRTQDLNLTPEVQAANSAIETYALPADRARLKIAVTETNAADWSGQWPNVNDLGHGLALFEILGQQMAHPRVMFTQLWNTRWINNSAQPPELWDALTPQNLLNATGQATAVWGQFLLDQLVSSTSPSVTLKTFAAHSASARKTHVFLINKDTQPIRARVSFAQPPGTAVATRWTFTGTGPEDTKPTFSQADDVPLALGQAVLTLPPLSVTVLGLQSQEIQSNPPAPLANLVSNGGFEAASLGWEDWGSSSDQAGVGASGTYGMVVGPGAGGRGQMLSRVKPGSRYVLAGQGRVGTTGEIGWLGMTFISSTGVRSQQALEFTGTTYAQRSLAFTTPADMQSATVWVWKNPGLGGFFYADDVALAEAP